jgi:hypothetical protein
MILSEAVEILRRTPSLLSAWLEGLPDEWARCTLGPNTFSPYDVVGHLIHGERTDWMVRLRIILTHGPAQPFPPFDRFAMYEASKGKSLSALLSEFSKLRAGNLDDLVSLSLTSTDLQKTGTHPELGRVTIEQLIATWVAHDLDHVAQIARTLAHRYRDEVGPWRAFLGIYTRTEKTLP